MKEKLQSLKHADTKTLLLAVAAAILLIFGVTGSSRAALTYFSENYTAQIGMQNIGVTLVENGKSVSHRNYMDGEWQEGSSQLLANMLEKDEKLQPGKPYPEALTVRNTGNIDQYIKVTLKRYWTNEDGSKRTDMSPNLIDLNLLNGSGWMVDESASTPERTVLYYTKPLEAGAEAPALSDKITIDSGVLGKAKNTQKGSVITTTYEYNGARFALKAEVNAVQTHNAAQAIKSAWGVDVTVDADGNISLKK